MKYRKLLPVFILGMALGGNACLGSEGCDKKFKEGCSYHASAAEPAVKAPTPIVKEYQGEKYEISQVSIDGLGFLEASVGKKDEDLKIRANYIQDYRETLLILENPKTEELFLNIRDNHYFSGGHKDGKVDSFNIDGAYFRASKKSPCQWRFPEESSCKEAKELGGKVQEIFDKYDSLLKDVFDKETSKLREEEIKKLKEVIDKL